MTDAGALLAELRARGMWIVPAGPDAVEVGPVEMVDEALASQVFAARKSILEVLQHPQPWGCSKCGEGKESFPFMCARCRWNERVGVEA